MRRFLFELLVWLPVGAIPIVNGILRFTVYRPILGESVAGLASTALDMLLILGYAMLLQRKRPLIDSSMRLWRGILWLALSTANHFLLGHYLFGLSFAALAGKYGFLSGETWALISLVILFAPWLAGLRRSAGPSR